MSNWDVASQLDRAEGQRPSADWVAEQWGSGRASVLTINDKGAFATAGKGHQLRFEAAGGDYQPARHLLLGLMQEVVYFAVQDEVPGDRHTVREVGQHLSDAERELATTAVALTNWHRAEPRCPMCGRTTEIRNAGSSRYCPHDQRDLFPRTDPAIIVAITDPEDRLLLASQVVWGAHRVSVLAGFNEAGESLEQTVYREVFEESGIRLGAVRYFGSQPWPMPRSLMLGFSAEAITTEITVDGTEIGAADWYTRERVEDEVERGELILPGASSIAHRLITAWQEKRLR